MKKKLQFEGLRCNFDDYFVWKEDSYGKCLMEATPSNKNIQHNFYDNFEDPFLYGIGRQKII